MTKINRAALEQEYLEATSRLSPDEKEQLDRAIVLTATSCVQMILNLGTHINDTHIRVQSLTAVLSRVVTVALGELTLAEIEGRSYDEDNIDELARVIKNQLALYRVFQDSVGATKN